MDVCTGNYADSNKKLQPSSFKTRRRWVRNFLTIFENFKFILFKDRFQKNYTKKKVAELYFTLPLNARTLESIIKRFRMFAECLK